MNFQYGDASGLSGFLLLAASIVMELSQATFTFLDQHSGFVVSICSIMGAVLTYISFKQRKKTSTTNGTSQ